MRVLALAACIAGSAFAAEDTSVLLQTSAGQAPRVLAENQNAAEMHAAEDAKFKSFTAANAVPEAAKVAEELMHAAGAMGAFMAGMEENAAVAANPFNRQIDDPLIPGPVEATRKVFESLVVKVAFAPLVEYGRKVDHIWPLNQLAYPERELALHQVEDLTQTPYEIDQYGPWPMENQKPRVQAYGGRPRINTPQEGDKCGFPQAIQPLTIGRWLKHCDAWGVSSHDRTHDLMLGKVAAPLAEGFSDMRGVWRGLVQGLDPIRYHSERVEQCGDRVVITVDDHRGWFNTGVVSVMTMGLASGWQPRYVQDFFHADGTFDMGVDDWDPHSLPRCKRDKVAGYFNSKGCFITVRDGKQNDADAESRCPKFNEAGEVIGINMRLAGGQFVEMVRVESVL